MVALDFKYEDQSITGLRTDFDLCSLWRVGRHTPEERDEFLEGVRASSTQVLTDPDIPRALIPGLEFAIEGRDNAGGVTAGFPFRSLAAASWKQVPASTGGTYVGEVRGGIRLATYFPRFAATVQGHKDSVIPLTPIFPGFAINTALYAATLYVLFFGFFDVRRFRRARCGRCLACGYDLKGADGGACSECGLPMD